jgi:hypothetical protein
MSLTFGATPFIESYPAELAPMTPATKVAWSGGVIQYVSSALYISESSESKGRKSSERSKLTSFVEVGAVVEGVSIGCRLEGVVLSTEVVALPASMV